MGAGSRSNLRKFRVMSWDGGLNLKDSSFVVNDNELTDSRNVSLSTRGAIRVIRGSERYETGSNDHLDANYRTPVQGMYRYGKSTGEREIIIHNAQDMVFVDGGTRSFSLLKGSVGDLMLFPTTDGWMRFIQWKDTVYFITGSPYLFWYHRDGEDALGVSKTNGLVHMIPEPPTYNDIEVTAVTTSGTGSLDTGKNYTYRFTGDVYRGSDFVGETQPFQYWNTIPGATRYINQTNTGYDAYNIIKNTSSSDMSTLLTKYGIKYVNIYRYEGDAYADEMKQEPDFYWAGSFSTAEWDSASNGDILFVDRNNETPSPQKIRYDIKAYPPRAMFAAIHKNRMWYLNESQLYFSEYDKPESVREDSWFNVGIADGEKPTGIVSWKNKVLLVFKPNSIWAIYGGDNEAQYKGQTTGLLDIQIEQVSGDIGCIAPNTISMGENAIFFLSNRGVYYFDGTVPKSLNTEMIKPALDRVPAHRKYYAAGEYVNHLREYRIAVSDEAVDPNRNRVVFKYDFYTNTWIRHEYARISINDFLEFERGDEIGSILVSNDDTSASLVSNGSIMYLEHATYDVLTTSKIPWDTKTKFFDCGDPETIKQFIGLMVHGEFPQGMTVTYSIDSGRVTGTLTVSSSGSIAWNDGTKWDDSGATWQGSVEGDDYQRFADTDIGKRIQFDFSGNTSIWPTEIQGITIFYKTKERVGNV